MNTTLLLRNFVIAALVTSMLFLIFNVLRLAFIYNIAHSFLVLNTLTAIGIAFVGLWQWRKLSITRLEWLIISALLLSIVFADYTGRAIAHIAIDVARPVLFLAVIITLRHCLDWTTFSNARIIQKLLVYLVGTTAVAVVGCTAVDSFIKGIYPAYSSIDSVLGLGWLMAASSTTAPLLFLCVLIFSGKRAVYLAASFAMMMFYRKQPKMLKSIIIITCLGLMLSVINVQNHGLGTYEKITEYYSGGRLDEIRDAIAAVPSLHHFITGMGPGFAYSSKLFASDTYLHRNLHFTPLSLIIYYGLIFSVLLAIYIARMLPAAWRALNDISSPVAMSYGIYFFASIPYSLTEYNIFAYSNLAIACGLIAAFDKNSRAIERP